MRGQQIVSLLVHAPTHCPKHPGRLARLPFVAISQRHYATYKDRTTPNPAAPSGSESNVYGQTSRSAFEGSETVGPFPLGVGSSGRSQVWKPWKELGVGGKCECTFGIVVEVRLLPLPSAVAMSHGMIKLWSKLTTVGRTVKQSANLGIILLGGGLFVVLTLSLTTELFAKNSPSVLYSQAVDLIRSSDAVSLLRPPLSTAHNPLFTLPPKPR